MLPSGTFCAIKDSSTGKYYHRTYTYWSDKFTLSAVYHDEKHAKRAIARDQANFNGRNVDIIEFSYIPTANNETGTLHSDVFFSGAKRSVRKDVHSLYIKYNQRIWRPVQSTTMRFQKLPKIQGTIPVVNAAHGTLVRVRDVVKIRLDGCVLIDAEQCDGSFVKRFEAWHSHGSACVRTAHNELVAVPHERCWSPID